MTEELYQTSLKNAFFFEENGEIEAALSVLKALVLLAGKDSHRVQIELAKMKIRNNMAYEALLDLCIAYKNSHDNQLSSFIMESFYDCHKDEYEKNVQRNIALLSNYSLFYGDTTNVQIDIRPLWMDDKNIILFDEKRDEFIQFSPVPQSYYIDENDERGDLLINPVFATEIEKPDKYLRPVQPVGN